MVDGVLGEERRVEHLVLRPADRPEDRARPELAGQRQVLFAEELLHEALLIFRVVDDEPSIDPDRLTVAAQDAGAQRVERACLHVTAGLADEADDPLAQLAGGTVRERHRQDRPRTDVLHADEVGDPMGEDTRLARAGAGQDQERPFGRGDGAALLGVEPGDDLGRPRLGPDLARGALLVVAGTPLVGRELDRNVTRDRHIAEPRRLLWEALGGLLGDVRKERPLACRSVLGQSPGAGPAGRGWHTLIVGRGTSPGLLSGSCRALLTSATCPIHTP